MSIFDRSDNFSQTEKDNMFLSWQAYDGLQITVHSTTEAVKYALRARMSFMLKNVLTKMPLKNTLVDIVVLGAEMIILIFVSLVITSNAIRLKRSKALLTGNTRESHKKKRHVSRV